MAFLMIATTEQVNGKPSHLIFVDLDQKEDTLARKVASYAEVQQALRAGTLSFKNVALGQDGELKGVGGDISRYTQLSRKPDQQGKPCLKPIGKPSFVVAAETDSGYVLVSYKGERRLAKEEVIIQRDVPLANAKIVTVGNTKHISAIKGTFEKIADYASEKIKTPPPTDMSQTYGVATDLTVGDKQNSHIITMSAPTSGILPTTSDMIRASQQALHNRVSQEKGIELESIPDKHSDLNCLQKLNRLNLTIRAISPIYSTILHSLSIVATRKVETMGVNLETLVINPEFFAELKDEEALFVLFHELGHVLYGHVHRRGTRDPEVWNLAADMIVNAMLVADMKCKPGETVNLPTSTNFVNTFSVLDSCIYNSEVDPDKDNVESIYSELIKDAKTETSNLSGSGSSQSDSGQSSSSQSGSGSGQTGQSSGQSSSSSGQTGQTGQSGQDSSQSSQSGQGSGQSGQGSGSGSGQSSSGQTGQGSGSFGKLVKTTYTFRGKKVTSTYHADIDTSEYDKAVAQHGKDVAKQALEGKYKDLMSRVKTATQRSRGTASIDIRATNQITLETAPEANWRTLLDSKVKKGKEAYYTYARPDRRFLARGDILPGPKFEENCLDNLIIAIDVSGSISQEDLNVIGGHIWNICKKYQVSAHIVYWDTEVRKVEKLKRKEDIVRLRPPDGGGTAVNSFLDWYNKTVCSPRGFIPCATIIITDGWIECSSEIKNVRRGKEDFIWLIVDESKYLDFKPKFGKKAIYRR